MQTRRSSTTGDTKGMIRVSEGTFLMGSDEFYPEERPVHRVDVDGFWMDEHPVTVAQFRRFVKATGYVTLAERPPDPAALPGCRPELLVPGSLVFRPTPGPWILDDVANWWSYVPGADLAASGGAREHAPRAGPPPRDAHRVPRTRRRTRHGPGRRCPPKPSGSSPREAGWKVRRSSGATSSRPRAR